MGDCWYALKTKSLYLKLTWERPDPLLWTPEEIKSRRAKKSPYHSPDASLALSWTAFSPLCKCKQGSCPWGANPKTWGQHQPVAFLSKFLDPVTSGWPQRIQAIVVIKVFLAEESRKITFGRSLVSTPHQVRTILNQKVERWLTDSRILKYEAILLLEKDDLTLTADEA
jgi:hypothetical protein